MPYTGFDPATDPVDAVRFLVGDTTSPFQLTDAEVQFALDSTTSTYAAGALCARSLAAKVARYGKIGFETLDVDYGQVRANYESLARHLDMQAKRRGGLGMPQAGGISRAEIEAVDADTDRVRSWFRDGQFHNPPAPNE